MRTAVCALLAGLIACTSACAARDARPRDGASAQRAAAPAGDAQVSSRYREMTWAEYYTEVTERVWKRGGTVLWISPPNVRRVQPAFLLPAGPP